MLASAINRAEAAAPSQKQTPATQSTLSSTRAPNRDASGFDLQHQSRLRNSSVTHLSLGALKPSPPSAVNARNNASRRDWPLPGTKRTAAQAAGLTATLMKQDSFQDSQPIIIQDDVQSSMTGIGQLHEAVYFDENDFEDDADLDLDVDIDDPISKPTVPQAVPLPAAPPRENLPPPSNPAPPTTSSQLPWSSSPVEHKVSTLNARASTQATAQASTRASSQAGSRSIPQTNIAEDSNPRPSKRRVIPWLKEEQQSDASQAGSGVRFDNQRRSNQISKGHITPLPKEKSNSPFWDTTQSAIKEEQKKLKQANRKSNKAKEGLDGGTHHTTSGKTRGAPSPIFLSDEQSRVVDFVVNQGKSVFFTGSAGTGKSVLLREIIAALRRKHSREPDRVAVTASTGLAACNIGGVTLHSYGGIGLGKESATELVKRVKKNQKAKSRWIRTKVLIIDEISMVDGELFDKLERIARDIKNNGRPFGGIQLIITGDFFQLPPVPDYGKLAKFAFEATTWNTAIHHTIRLTQVFRQKDPAFADMLNEMRLGKLSQKSIETFRSLSRPIHYNDDLDATELFPTRNEVDNANNVRMRNLTGPSYLFEARDGGSIMDKTQRDKLLSNCMAPPLIELKKGSQVMLIKNIDVSLVNGSLGKVVGFMDERKFDSYHEDEELQAGEGTDSGEDESLKRSRAKLKAMAMLNKDLAGDTSKKWPLVRFSISDGTSRDLLCQPESWSIELPNGEVQASRSQVPLILAWALSIHKAQGQTMERVKVDLGRVFEKGQAYVALSRATSQEGLQVLRFDPRKVMAHDKVREFYNGLYSVGEVGSSGRRLKKPPNPAAVQDKGFRGSGADFDDDEEALLMMENA